MSSIKGGSVTTSSSSGPIVRCGHLKKLKTLKKKYFVLRGEAPGHAACLEYYDSRKKFASEHPPKRSICLHSCFNINQRGDTKHKNVIALYTKDECFCLVLENEHDLKEWLQAMLLLQNGNINDGVQPRPTFEHVWQVTMQKKGLGERKNIHGQYRLCLTDRTLSLVKVGVEDPTQDSLEFSLGCIRRSGVMDRIFYMDVGRSAVTGSGDLWMEAEDSNIANNMSAAILSAMNNSGSNKDREDVLRPRPRVISSNEVSKPISVLPRRNTTQKSLGFPPLEEKKICKERTELLAEQATAHSQSSQSQSTTESSSITLMVAGNGAGTGIPSTNANYNIARRRHSVASHPHSVNNSQSVHVTTTTSTTTITIITTATVTTTTTTATISHQRTLSLPLAAVIINHTQSSKRSVLRCTSGRDRCDSLPSRARTSSEGHPINVVLSHPRSGHFVPHVPRPHSMYGRGVSYSPPVSSMPISPASGACSTDSAGSSLSMDDGGAENTMEEGPGSRYGHSLTPDEPVILEENGDDYALWSSVPLHHKYSPNLKSHSPSQQSSYVDMYSPCGSSPGRGSGYMPMSPATTIHSHSRTSSLVEEHNGSTDGYVPMAPGGYVDMDSANGHFPDDMSQHGGSSCSVTSGTPSTDLRFSEYHLDKVTSFLTPGEDAQARPTRAYSVGSRPEPTNRHRKNRLDIVPLDTNRERAFSVGSRSKRPEIGRLANVTVTNPLPSDSSEGTNSNKSNSAPLLSSSWGHNSTCSGISSDRMEDLMELDFTKPSATNVFSSPSSSLSQSHSQSCSTATDVSSYVDMSPGQQSVTSTATAAVAPYVDMSGPKSSRNNNNNNTITANQNHSFVQGPSMVSTHKPIISTLKPVEEAESSYMTMNSGLGDWTHPVTSPKQLPSPLQEDCVHMNGPPGGVRTAPVDLPQPRKPPEGYVEMSFKSRPSFEQNYINMSVSSNGRNSNVFINSNGRRTGSTSRKEKKSCSQPIAIQASSKSTKTPCFLPLNISPKNESSDSTPVSPPQATPTGSSSTIFPFSLNSPQSPMKPLLEDNKKTERLNNTRNDNDYAPMDPIPKVDSAKQLNDDKVSRNKRLNNSSPTKENNNKTFNSKKCKDSNLSKEERNSKDILRRSTINSSQDAVMSPIIKKLDDLNVTKSQFVTASPNTSPSPNSQTRMPSPKFAEESSDTPTSCTPVPTPLDMEGFDKIQLTTGILHYARLDLPDMNADNIPPVSPASVRETFNYAEIDFAKLKQN